MAVVVLLVEEVIDVLDVRVSEVDVVWDVDVNDLLVVVVCEVDVCGPARQLDQRREPKREHSPSSLRSSVSSRIGKGIPTTN